MEYCMFPVWNMFPNMCVGKFTDAMNIDETWSRRFWFFYVVFFTRISYGKKNSQRWKRQKKCNRNIQVYIYIYVCFYFLKTKYIHAHTATVSFLYTVYTVCSGLIYVKGMEMPIKSAFQESWNISWRFGHPPCNSSPSFKEGHVDSKQVP